MKKSKDLYYVEFNQIPQTLADAFVVMEDKDFYEHAGVDLKAIIRAVIANQKSNDIAQGASTAACKKYFPYTGGYMGKKG